MIFLCQSKYFCGYKKAKFPFSLSMLQLGSSWPHPSFSPGLALEHKIPVCCMWAASVMHTLGKFRDHLGSPLRGLHHATWKDPRLVCSCSYNTSRLYLGTSEGMQRYVPPRPLTLPKMGSSLFSSSLSSALLSLYLSPSFPEYLWKVVTITASACSRGHAIASLLRAWKAEHQGWGQGRLRAVAEGSVPPTLPKLVCNALGG